MWGQIIGAVAGGLLANKGAKADRAAQERMNAQNNQYLNAAMPYIKDQLGSVSDMYKGMMDKGPYTGAYYAGPNDMQTAANNAMYGMGMNNMTYGQNLMNQAGGFAGNASSLFDQYSSMADRPDMMSKATDYATDNMNPIVEAMMRDDKRALTEQTLPGINRAASASGNPNSSRAGVADALANRAFDDRKADVSTDVFNSLRNASLTQSNNEFNQSMNALRGAGAANTTLGNAFTTGTNLATAGGNMALGAGGNQNTWDQGQINADRDNYDYLNNYGYNLGKDYMGFLTGNNVTGNYQMNSVSPGAATLGGAMSGFGFGNQLANSGAYIPGNSSFFDPLFGGSGLGIQGGFHSPGAAPL
jgi:hypothetical protein